MYISDYQINELKKKNESDETRFHCLCCENNVEAIDVILESDTCSEKERTTLTKIKESMINKHVYDIFFYIRNNYVYGYGIVGFPSKDIYLKKKETLLWEDDNASEDVVNELFDSNLCDKENEIFWGIDNKCVAAVYFQKASLHSIIEILEEDYRLKYSQKTYDGIILNNVKFINNPNLKKDINRLHILLPSNMTYKSNKKYLYDTYRYNSFDEVKSAFSILDLYNTNFDRIIQDNIINELIVRYDYKIEEFDVTLYNFLYTNLVVFDICLYTFDDYKINIDKLLKSAKGFNDGRIVNLFEGYTSDSDLKTIVKFSSINNNHYVFDSIIYSDDNSIKSYVKQFVNVDITDEINDNFCKYNNRIIYTNRDYTKLGISNKHLCFDKLFYADNIQSRYQVLMMSILKLDILLYLNENINKEFTDGKTKSKNDVVLFSDKMYSNVMLLNSCQVFDNNIDINEIQNLNEKFGINQLENNFNSKIDLFKEMCDIENSKTNNNLADMLNTIQISSIILTIFGWFLVIFQGQSSMLTTYILLIIVFSIFSVIIAILIKNIISKK